MSAEHRYRSPLLGDPLQLRLPREDPIFPIGHARRYAAELTEASVVEIGDSYSLTPEDQPVALADAIAAFAGR